MGRLFGTDGVRGVANSELTCEMAMRIGRAAAMVLPDSNHRHPKVLIGKTTEDCMRSGIVYGTAGMLDGVIDRIREQFSGRTLSVVATGGNAPVIVKYCRNKIVYDKYLLMDGLWAIYQKNK